MPVTPVEVGVVDLWHRLKVALREIGSAPLDWNGYEMAALLALALVVFVLALIATGGAGGG